MKNNKIIIASILLLLMIILITFSTFIKLSKKNNVVMGSQIVYSYLPQNISQLIEIKYNEEHKEKIKVVSLSEEDYNLRIQNKEKFPPNSIILASKNKLEGLKKEGLINKKLNHYSESIMEEFKDPQDFWLGIWYDPVVFCYNKDYVKKNWDILYNWEDFTKNKKLKIATMDILNTYAGENLLVSMAEDFGVDKTIAIMKNLDNNMERYSKYLSTPVRMAGMNEVDMAIAMQSDCLKYINNKYPLVLIYPQEKTAYLLTGVGVYGEITKEGDTFLWWLLNDDLQLILQNNELYFMPTNLDILAQKKYSDDRINFFKEKNKLDDTHKKMLIDTWVKEIRLSK